jgi:putative N-acetylmannosamine-6-phosphate epimerase
MTREQLIHLLQEAPLVASVQADAGTPLADPESILRLARASAAEGVRMLRLEGVENIRRVRAELPLPCIGLIKRRYPNSDIIITPTVSEVEELLATPAEIIAIDATLRPRPGGEAFPELVRQVQAGGRLVLADCDSIESMHAAAAAGADAVSTTLSGYTGGATPPDPDLELVRQASQEATVPVIAEGRFAEAWQAQAALRAGAAGVVIGGALNDPIKQTRRFRTALQLPPLRVGAFDIGGTWLRFGVFDQAWRLLEQERIPLPAEREARLDWMAAQAERARPDRIAISSGGTIDPSTSEVVEAKAIIPGHEGTVFSARLGPCLALNDGLATAWGHGCLPGFAGLRVATLALGTGVGFGVVDRMRLLCGPRGEYPRLNDINFSETLTIEEALGGAVLGDEERADWDQARRAATAAIKVVDRLFLPDRIVICGGVGLSGRLTTPDARVVPSPFGADAGLYGAAALALFPPLQFS